ncbi:hypothetical protein V6N13_117322 [Hibiscus sabdariffa]|uniref:Bifunctional inhibitor/plant lipid transfer protein/seed storage helical domain-containing protein n=1 Tax=Hibiscus sabdariffa TaxID=183260 RepID=A0ABR2PA80_9ROSI
MFRLVTNINVFLLIIGSAAIREPSYCSRVTDHFYPCITYTVEFDPRPTDGCCSGLEELNRMSKHNRRAPKIICQCIENMGYVMDVPFIASRIKSLSDECHTHFNFSISVAMKCFG